MLRRQITTSARRVCQSPRSSVLPCFSSSSGRVFSRRWASSWTCSARDSVTKLPNLHRSEYRPVATSLLDAAIRQRRNEWNSSSNIMVSPVPCIAVMTRPILSVSFPTSAALSVSFASQVRHASLSLTERIRRPKRWKSSSSKGGSPKGTKTKDTSNDTAISESSSPSAGTVSSPPGTGRLSSIVQSVGPTLRKVTEWNLGDLASVFGILLLILLIVVLPSVVEQMRKSDSTYDEMLDMDDPIAYMDKVIREEKLGHKIREGSGLVVGGDDPERKAVDNTVNMAADVLNSEALQEAIVSLINRVLESTHFQSACQRLLKNLWDDLVNDPETTVQVVQLLNNAIQNKEIQRAFKRLVMQIINDRDVYDELTRLLVRLGQEPEIKRATQDLLAESAHSALNDPEILDHSMEFATDVVGDDIVQRTSGEALRNTVSYAVTPGLSIFLSVLGIGLLIFSISAFGNSRASEQEAVVVERAMTAFTQSFRAGANDTVAMLLSLPGRILSSCASFLVSIAKFPFRMVGKLVSRMERGGGSTTAFMTSALTSIVAWPAVLASVSFAYLGRLGRSLTRGLSTAMEKFIAAVGGSFVGSTVRAMSQAIGSIHSAVSQSFASFATTTLAAISALGSKLLAATEKCGRSWTYVSETSVALGKLVLTACQTSLSSTMVGVDRIESWLIEWTILVAYTAQTVSATAHKGTSQAIEEVSRLAGTLVRWVAIIRIRRDDTDCGDSGSTTH